MECDVNLKAAPLNCKNLPIIEKKLFIDLLGNVSDEYGNLIKKNIILKTK
jgi:hypothetical protein